MADKDEDGNGDEKEDGEDSAVGDLDAAAVEERRLHQGYDPCNPQSCAICGSNARHRCQILHRSRPRRCTCATTDSPSPPPPPSVVDVVVVVVVVVVCILEWRVTGKRTGQRGNKAIDC